MAPFVLAGDHHPNALAVLNRYHGMSSKSRGGLKTRRQKIVHAQMLCAGLHRTVPIGSMILARRCSKMLKLTLLARESAWIATSQYGIPHSYNGWIMRTLYASVDEILVPDQAVDPEGMWEQWRYPSKRCVLFVTT